MKIVRTENICFGRPRIDGTRLEVYDVISELSYSKNSKQYREERNFTRGDLLEIINYCKSLKCQEMKYPFERYCSGCILSTLHENYDYKSIDFEEMGKEIFIDSNNSNLMALGDKSDLQDEFSGKPGWIIADSIVV
ncbi:MAG TPA: DUF433 domain-containing protein [Emticicia sp.]